jgi:hypothetical protein
LGWQGGSSGKYIQVSKHTKSPVNLFSFTASLLNTLNKIPLSTFSLLVDYSIHYQMTSIFSNPVNPDP